MPRTRLELVTRGFSVHCSTNWAISAHNVYIIYNLNFCQVFSFMSSQKMIFSYLGVLFYFFIIIFPSYFLISPVYWSSFVQNPKYYLLTFILFLLPIPFLLKNPRLNNPFFCLPFSCSFIVASISLNFAVFLKNYLLFIGLIATLFGLFRTKRPFILLEIQLYLTSFFIDFFEVKNFWRTLMIVICYNYIPFSFIISLQQGWTQVK